MLFSLALCLAANLITLNRDLKLQTYLIRNLFLPSHVVLTFYRLTFLSGQEQEQGTITFSYECICLEIRAETSIYTAECSMCFCRLLRAVILSLISIWHWEAFRGFTTSAASVDALSVCHLFLASRCICAKTKRVSIQPITKTDVLFCKLSLAPISKTQVSISISYRYSIFYQIKQAIHISDQISDKPLSCIQSVS